MNSITLSAILQLDAEDRAARPRPSKWILDRIADEKINAGYDRVRRNSRTGQQIVLHPTCSVCGIKKAANGSCFC